MLPPSPLLLLWWKTNIWIYLFGDIWNKTRVFWIEKSNIREGRCRRGAQNFLLFDHKLSDTLIYCLWFYVHWTITKSDWTHWIRNRQNWSIGITQYLSLLNRFCLFNCDTKLKLYLNFSLAAIQLWWQNELNEIIVLLKQKLLLRCENVNSFKQMLQRTTTHCSLSTA